MKISKLAYLRNILSTQVQANVNVGRSECFILLKEAERLARARGLLPKDFQFLTYNSRDLVAWCFSEKEGGRFVTLATGKSLGVENGQPWSRVFTHPLLAYKTRSKGSKGSKGSKQKFKFCQVPSLRCYEYHRQ